MLNYNQALPEQTLLQDLQMKEIKPIMKLVIRGRKREFISAIGKSLNIILPTEANTSTQSDKLTALWLSPDEWMIFSNEPNAQNTNTYETEKLATFKSGYAVTKFKNVDTNGVAGSDSSGNHPDTDLALIRLAEVYLNYAEAVARGGGGSIQTATSYINELRTRAGAPTITSSELLNEVEPET